MASIGEQQAIGRVAPAAASLTTRVERAFRFTAAVNGSTTWTIPGVNSQSPGCWVTITNLSATDPLFFNAGRSSVTGDTPNCDTANDSGIPPGGTQDYWCGQGVDTIKYGSTTGAVPVSCHRSCL